MKAKYIKESLTDYVKPKEFSFNYPQLIHDWIYERQGEYIQFLNSLFMGKSIQAMAMKWSVSGHHWNVYDIINIQEISAKGGYFYTEVAVMDENNEWYTLHKETPSNLIK